MLWGGRFKKKFADEGMEFSSSLNFDINLLDEDIEVSIAHTKMLAKCDLLTGTEEKKIIEGLRKILEESKNGFWFPDAGEFEDIHSAVESRLLELIGDVAKKLHTGRSRNDQVVTGFRLWLKKAINQLINEIIDLQKILLAVSEKHTETIIPGYTHLQRAQPVSLAFHFLAYMEMFERDKKRLKFVFEECDTLPLGSGALAGSTLPLDREYSAEILGFSKISANAMDSVSDRDFAIDFLNSCNIGMMHLSRIAEEIILWVTQEWNFLKIGDEFTTGSSLMPQKKNPDLLELIRGKSGRTFGNYLSLITMMKGLPLSYNRDMQEDKEPVFDSFIQYSKSLKIFSKILRSLQIDNKRFLKELDGDFILATDMAEWLVLQGIPFRDAHKIVGELVLFAEEKQIKLNEVKQEDLLKIHPLFADKNVKKILSIENALSRKKTYGSPNPSIVKKEIKKWKKVLYNK